jgi:hypothetical protein
MKRIARIISGLVVLGLFLCDAGSQAAYAQDPSLPGPFAVTREEYDFGDTAFTPPGFPGPVEIRGSVHYPTNWTGAPLPLILFLHGRHGVCFQGSSDGPFQWPCPAPNLPIPSYTGYDYISQILASHGYMVVSISANGINAVDNTTSDFGALARAQLIQQHLNLWATFSSVGGAPFGTKFVGKVNMQRIGTMGHSRGGEGVVRHFTLNQSLGSPYGIKAVFALAPVDFSRFVINNVPLAVLLPYCDGDVRDLQGVHFYDDARYNVPGDPAAKHSILVLGANHNFYNTIWTPGSFPASTSDDWLNNIPSGSSDPHCGTGAGNGRLTDAQERATALVYLSAFLRVYVGGESQFLPLLTGAAAPPASAGTSDLFVSYHAPDVPQLRKDVNRLLNATNLTTSTLGGAVTATGLVPYLVCGGPLPQPPQCLPGQLTSRQPHTVPSLFSSATGLSQLMTGWSAATATLVHDIPAGQRNVSGFEALRFRAGVNFDDARNAAGMAQDFTVTLTDGAAATGSVRVSNSSRSLFFPPGTINAVPKIFLNMVRIPLSAFVGINLTDVRSITFKFDQNPQGALMVTDLAFASVQPAVSLPPPAVFDTCLQDDSSGSVLQFNSTTGDYAFCCASGVTVSGKGIVSKQGNIYSLQQGSVETDRRLTVKVDQGLGRGTATLQSPPGRTVCTISDRNTKNNTCVCGSGT